MIVHRSTTRVMAPPTETTPLAHKNEIAHTPLGHTETTPDTPTTNYWRPAEEPISALAQEKTSRDTSDTGFHMTVLAKLHYICTVVRRHARCLQNGASMRLCRSHTTHAQRLTSTNHISLSFRPQIHTLYHCDGRLAQQASALVYKHKKKFSSCFI